MATSKDVFSGSFSGRLGNVIGYEWRGKMCVRSMPSHYRDAQTPRQLAHRALFKATVGFATKARHIIDKGLQQVSLNAQMTEARQRQPRRKTRHSQPRPQRSTLTMSTLCWPTDPWHPWRSTHR